MYTKEQSRLIGIALRSQAIAEAMGEDFEFDPCPAKDELADLINSGEMIHITDDTQMTMFGLEAMIMGGPSTVIAHYLMWDKTQHYGTALPPMGSSQLLVDQLNMWQVRAPGNTCLRSLQDLLQDRPVKNNSNGCGTVMKALPFLFDENSDLLRDISYATHKGPQIIPTAIKHWQVAQKILRKEKLNMYEGKSLEYVFGDGGWQAEYCLDIAIWAFENCNGDFNKLLELSILHDGDSDSVAATAGALYGLFYETYPVNLYDRVYEKDTIDMLIDRMEKLAI